LNKRNTDGAANGAAGLQGKRKMPVLINHPFTIFSKREAADKLAATCNADDDVTVYTVVTRDDGRFVI
jgi:hypothetical protein